MKKLVLILPILLLNISIFCQSTDTYLMKIDGRSINSEEFLRVYNKNNNITPESEKKSIDEYLDLFINYKLKVIEAENLGYDTVHTFIDEFTGYRNQLAKPYLQNEELKEDLIKEAYSRYKSEVNASHILIRCESNALPEDTLKAYEKIMDIRARVIGGEPFVEVAKATSDDPSVKDNGGKLGYFSAFRMVYPFETAAFNTPVGKISKPLRTSYGYHILKINDKRDSRGTVKVAHAMTRISKTASAPEKKAAKEKIDAAYAALMNGDKWEDVVLKYSENPRTKENKGEVGWLQPGQAPDNFLDACYALEEGNFSKPIETPGGYHIAYVLEKKSVESYEEAHEKISRRIDNDDLRKQTLKDLMNSELVNKYGLKTNKKNAEALISVLDSNIFKSSWNPSVAENMSDAVVTIGDKSYSQFDFAKYMSGKRFSVASENYNTIISKSLSDYSADVLMAYAMDNLPNENDDYKYLLKEYHDGILLFNLTNELVWQRAQEDSTGLEKFYKNADKYNWGERIKVAIYEYSDNSFTAKLPKLAKKQTKKKLSDNFLTKSLCPTDTVPCISSSIKTYEKGQDAITDKFTWEAGTYTNIVEENQNFMYYVVKVIPAEAKKLNEARGLYIADYQSHLETKWIVNLREKYTIDINNSELEKIKSELN